MAGTRIVGRVGIRVVPELDDFRDKLKDQVEKSAKNVKVKVGMTHDARGFRQGILDEVRDYNNDIAGSDAHKVKLQVALNTKGLSSSLQKWKHSIESTFEKFPIKVRAELDFDDRKKPKDIDIKGNLNVEDPKVKIKDKVAAQLRVVLDKDSVKDAINDAQSIADHNSVSLHMKVFHTSIGDLAKDIRGAADGLADVLDSELSKQLKDRRVGINAAVNVDDMALDDLAKKLRSAGKPVSVNAKVDVDDAELGSLSKRLKSKETKVVIQTSVDVDQSGWNMFTKRLRENIRRSVDIGDSINPRRIRKSFEDMFPNVKPLADLGAAMRRAKTDVSRMFLYLKAARRDDVKSMQEAERGLTSYEKRMRGVHGRISRAFRGNQLGREFIAFNMALRKAMSKDIRVQIRADVKKASIAKAKALFALAFKNKYAIEIGAKLKKDSIANIGKAIHRLSGGRMLDEFSDAFVKPLANIDMMALKLGALLPIIALVSAAVLALSGHILAFGASLVQMVPAALALPGLLAGIGVGAAAFGVGLADINKRLPEIGKSLKATKAAMQDNFWKEALGPMRAMAKMALPAIDAGMRKVSTAAGGFTASLVSSFGVLAQSKNYTNVFDAAAKGIENMTKGSHGMAQIASIITSIGASYLPALGNAIADVANKWGHWLLMAEKTGRLKEMIDTGIQRVKEFGSAVYNLAGILASLGQAALAAGGGTIGGLANNLRDLNKAINSIDGQAKIVQIFKTANEAMDNFFSRAKPGLAAFAKSFGGIFNAVAPQIASALGGIVGALGKAFGSPEVSGAVTGFLKTVTGALEMLRPHIEGLGPSIAAVVEVAGALLAALTPILDGILKEAGPLIQQIKGPIIEIIGLLGTGLNAIIQALLPPIREVIAALLPALVPIVAALVGAIQRFLPVLQPIVAIIAQMLKEYLPMYAQYLSLVVTIIGMAANVIGIVLLGALNLLKPILDFFFGLLGRLCAVLNAALKPALEAVGALLRGDFSTAWQKAKEAATILWNGLKEIAKWVVSEFKAAWNKIGPMVMAALRAAWNWVQSIGSSILSTARAKWSEVVASTRAKWEEVKAALAQKVSEMLQKAKEKFNQIVSEAKAMPGKAKAAIGNVGTLLVSAGRNLVSGFINGMKQKIESVVSTARDMAGRVVSAVKNALTIKSPSRVFMEIGGYVAEGMGIGIERETKKPVAASRVMAAGVVSAAERAAAKSAVQRNFRIAAAVEPERGALPDAMMGGRNVTINTYNPVAEKPSETLNKSQQLLALL